MSSCQPVTEWAPRPSSPGSADGRRSTRWPRRKFIPDVAHAYSGLSEALMTQLGGGWNPPDYGRHLGKDRRPVHPMEAFSRNCQRVRWLRLERLGRLRDPSNMGRALSRASPSNFEHRGRGLCRVDMIDEPCEPERHVTASGTQLEDAARRRTGQVCQSLEYFLGVRWTRRIGFRDAGVAKLPCVVPPPSGGGASERGP